MRKSSSSKAKKTESDQPKLLPKPYNYPIFAVVSFVFALVGIVCLLIIIPIANTVLYSHDSSALTSMDAILLGFFGYFAAALEVMAFVLGIVGCMQKNKLRIFAILGTLIATILLGLLVYGLLVV